MARARGLGVAVLLVLACAATGRAQEVTEYYATDAVGSVRVVFSPAGTVLARADFYPFGEEFTVDPAFGRIRFGGQETDTEAGFDYFNARFLQPRAGRFSTVDPVIAEGAMTDPQLWNRYSFALNSPVTHTDPSGLCPEGYYCAAETVTVTAPLAPGMTVGTGGDYTVGQGSLADLAEAGMFQKAPDRERQNGQGLYQALQSAATAAQILLAGSGQFVAAAAVGVASAGLALSEGEVTEAGLAAVSVLPTGRLLPELAETTRATFSGPIQSVTLQADLIAVRYWGDEALEIGRWLTTPETAAGINSAFDARSVLKLPATNSALERTWSIITSRHEGSRWRHRGRRLRSHSSVCS